MAPSPLASRALGITAGLALTLAACGGGSGETAAPTTTTRPGTELTIAAGPVALESAGPAGALSDADRDAVIDTVRRYVTAATVDPLLGRGVGDLAPLLGAAVGSSLTAEDRAALVDEGLPEASGTVHAVATPVALTALVDQAGAVDLVGAALDLTVDARTKQGPVTVHRFGELVLARDGAAWRIDSFRLSVDRAGAGLEPATTTTTGKGS